MTGLANVATTTEMSEPDNRCDPANQLARECLAVRVRALSRVITGVYDDALRASGVRITQVNILVVVGCAGRIGPAEVSRILRVERSTLSRDLELMKTRGWVASTPRGGGRSQWLELTPEGAECLRRVRVPWERAQAEVRGLIGPEGEAAIALLADRIGLGLPRLEPPEGRPDAQAAPPTLASSDRA